MRDVFLWTSRVRVIGMSAIITVIINSSNQTTVETGLIALTRL